MIVCFELGLVFWPNAVADNCILLCVKISTLFLDSVAVQVFEVLTLIR